MNIEIMFGCLFLTFSAVFMPEYSAAQDNGGWPRVAETQISKRFYTEDEVFELEHPISAAENGKQIYSLFCIGGKDEYLDSLSDRTGINIVGPLSCQLGLRAGFHEGSLLSEDASPPWHSRGQFHFDQLSGVCGIYPEYGRVRHFRLRAMLVTLTVEDIQEVNNRIDDFLLTIKVQNDPTALTAKAERPDYLPPRFSSAGVRDCDMILRGKNPLMCRNSETFSREKCPEGWEYEKYPWENGE